MPSYRFDTCLARAADVLVGSHFCVQEGESVLITADNKTDSALIDAVITSAARHGARPAVMCIPQLPYQGSLADPYICEPLLAAVARCDVWFDMAFPYMAGSRAFDEAMRAKRARYLLLGDIGAAGLARIYGSVDFDSLFELQLSVDRFLAQAEGKTCRVTSPLGTDFVFTMGKPASKKNRFANQAGPQTVPGSAIFYPELESVKGVIALEAMFHEYYTRLGSPLFLEIDGQVRALRGGAAESRIADRSLRRAGGGQYGNVIHLTVGLHPGAADTGTSFIEDIRVPGTNAIGLGLPWWVEGGGENHPDGVVRNQSLWIDGVQVVDEGRLLLPSEAVAMLSQLEPRFA